MGMPQQAGQIDELASKNEGKQAEAKASSFRVLAATRQHGPDLA